MLRGRGTGAEMGMKRRVFSGLGKSKAIDLCMEPLQWLCECHGAFRVGDHRGRLSFVSPMCTLFNP